MSRVDARQCVHAGLQSGSIPLRPPLTPLAKIVLEIVAKIALITNVFNSKNREEMSLVEMLTEVN